jgi:hypothetical protein
VTRRIDGLAVVERLQLGELVGVRQDQVADPPDEPASLRWGQLAPGAIVERRAGGADRPVDVLGVALGHLGEHLPGGRVRGLERLARCRGYRLPADEQLPGDSDEILDALFQCYCHGFSHLLRGSRCVSARRAQERTGGA